MNLYFTLIHSLLVYCITIWGSTSQENMLRLYRLQKRAARVICNSTFGSPGAPLLASLNILDVFSLYKYHLGIFMYSSHKKLLPATLTKYFIFNNETHQFNTRRNKDFHIPFARTSVTQKSVYFAGPKLWNSLPLTLKECHSLNIFKTKYKIMLD